MNPLFRRYGMRWTRRYPPIDWLGVWRVASPIIILLLAYIITELIDRHNAEVRRGREEHSARVRAEANLAACLSGEPLIDKNRGAGFVCQPGKEVAL